MIGQTIDSRYQVEALLGRGGMGAVYQATDLIDNRPVALKVLHFFLDAETELAQTRFHREFRVLARLDHPHIMRAYRYGSHDDVPYLALEFLAGHTLTDELVDAPLPRPRILNIARQICEALGYLHAQSIVHRDLKPGNLMLLPPDNTQASTYAQVKLMDFGLVRQTDLSRQLTQEGMALGTVAYMAPEQAQGLPVDFRADLYALGIILYEMATGQTPFVHPNPAMTLMQQLTMPPPPPSQLNPKLDEALEQLILELVAKEPAQRPGSAELLTIRLAQLADEAQPPVEIAPSLSPTANRADLIPRVPLIGRESAVTELAQRWAKAQTGQGQVILLAGAAGIGKSRLLTEASLPVQMGQSRFLSSYCRERTTLPYQPVINILSPLLHDLPTSVQKTLPAELKRLLARPEGDAPHDFGPSDQAEARQRLFAGCWEVLRQATQQQALMIAIENLQWAEPATLDLLGYLIDQSAQARLLIVLTYRPEEVEAGSDLAAFRRNLDHHRLAQIIELEPLTRDQVARFLQSALGRTSLPDWLVDSFHQATGGNPLFIEETLKTLAAEGQVAEWLHNPSSQWTKPASLALKLPQNVLVLAERRLQQLSTEDRSILTAAAVAGADFSFALLQGVIKLDEDPLLDAIDRLLATRLIEELPLQAGEDRYRFAQEALRQALLSTVSQRRLRSLHRRIGETIQTLYDTSQPRQWPALAYHFAEAGDIHQALKYFTLAGDAATQMYANAEAVGYYSHALKVASQAKASSDQLAHLYLQRGRALELNDQHDQALSNYEEMKKLAQERSDRALELAALMAAATIHSTFTSIQNPAQAQALLEQALTPARELGDRAVEAKILWNLLLLNLFGLGDPHQAVIYGEQSLALARKFNLREQLAFTLNDIQGGYLAFGQLERAQAALGEAQALWREFGNMPMLADNLGNSAFIYYLRGDYEPALAAAEEAYQVSQAIGNRWGQTHGWTAAPIYWERGAVDQAVAVMADSIHLSEQAGLAPLALCLRAHLGWMYGSLGAIEYGLELGYLARAEADEHQIPAFRLPWFQAKVARLEILSGNLAVAEMTIEESYRNHKNIGFNALAAFFTPLADGELALVRGDYAQVITVMDKLVSFIREVGAGTFLPEALYLKSKALLALHRADEAGEILMKARVKAEAIGSRRSLWPILVALSQLEADPTETENLRRQAREIVEYIADHLPTDLPDSFLGLPEVQAVK